jgi:hypothetical protein
VVGKHLGFGQWGSGQRFASVADLLGARVDLASIRGFEVTIYRNQLGIQQLSRASARYVQSKAQVADQLHLG